MAQIHRDRPGREGKGRQGDEMSEPSSEIGSLGHPQPLLLWENEGDMVDNRAKRGNTPAHILGPPGCSQA